MAHVRVSSTDQYPARQDVAWDRLAGSMVDFTEFATESTGHGVRVEFITERLAFDTGREFRSPPSSRTSGDGFAPASARRVVVLRA